MIINGVNDDNDDLVTLKNTIFLNPFLTLLNTSISKGKTRTWRKGMEIRTFQG